MSELDPTSNEPQDERTDGGRDDAVEFTADERESLEQLARRLKGLDAIVVPDNDDFTRDYLETPFLTDFGESVIASYPELEWLQGWRVRFLWRRKGSRRGGRPVLGTCKAASGLASYFGAVDWVVTIAADHVRERNFTRNQLEALIYHELMHCDPDGDKPRTREHDVEAFVSEIERFGLWQSALQAAGEAIKQLSLGLGE